MPARRQRLAPGLRQPDLPDRRRRLLLLEPQPLAGEVERAPRQRDRARRHHDHLRPARAQRGDIGGDAGQPGRSAAPPLSDRPAARCRSSRRAAAPRAGSGTLIRAIAAAIACSITSRSNTPHGLSAPGRKRRKCTKRSRLTRCRRRSSASGSGWSSARMSRSGNGSRVQILSAADCFPRLSPPAASPASSAVSSRSASSPSRRLECRERALHAPPARQHVAGDRHVRAAHRRRTRRRTPPRYAARSARSRRGCGAAASPARHPPPSSAAATSSGASPARRRGMPMHGVHRIDQRLRRQRRHAALDMDGERADREESRRHRRAERAGRGIARQDRPGHAPI